MPEARPSGPVRESGTKGVVREVIMLKRKVHGASRSSGGSKTKSDNCSMGPQVGRNWIQLRNETRKGSDDANGDMVTLIVNNRYESDHEKFCAPNSLDFPLS